MLVQSHNVVDSEVLVVSHEAEAVLSVLTVVEMKMWLCSRGSSFLAWHQAAQGGQPRTVLFSCSATQCTVSFAVWLAEVR